MRLHSHLQTAATILRAYNGSIPFHHFLKEFFKNHKKYGSSDRKHISHLCYYYFRLGAAYAEKEMEERLLIGQFLCSTGANVFLQQFRPQWNEAVTAPLEEKLQILVAPAKIFPFTEHLSGEIDAHAFNFSFLIQPDLFLRPRPGRKQAVTEKLRAAGIAFKEEDRALRLPNSSKIQQVLNLDEEAVVQDLNSQKVLEPLLQLKEKVELKNIWDCCAASGGKTILLHDYFPSARLTVSDIRSSILANLKQRLQRAGIGQYHAFVADLSQPAALLPQQSFGLVLCDAPCSGSGTWARTPEQLLYFKPEKIDHYANLQRSICLNAARSVAKNGYFLYVTCSVFKRENEDVVSWLQQQTGFNLLSHKYFKGYTLKADTLFAALLRF